MKKHLLKWQIIIIIFISFNFGCPECAFIDEHRIHIFYQDRKELINIKEYIEKYCLPIDCVGSDDCYRYFVTIQHIQSEKIDTIIRSPQIPNVGQKNNIKLTTRLIEEMIKSFNFNFDEHLPFIKYDSLKQVYKNKINDQEIVYAYFSKKNSKFYDGSVKNIYNKEALNDTIAGKTCKGIASFCILWEPTNGVEGKEKGEGEEGKGKGNGQRGEEGEGEGQPTVDCNLDLQFDHLISQLPNGNKQKILETVRLIAFNAIKCDDAESIKDALSKLETNKLKPFIKEYAPEYKGVKAALEYNDLRLINESIGSLKKVNEDIYQVSLLASNDIYYNSSELYNLPAFRIFTERIQITDPIKININWPVQEGGYETLEGRLKPGYPISKDFKQHIVTISMNSLESDPFVKIELNIKPKSPPPPPLPPPPTTTIDPTKDIDRDGFVGYLDVNDTDSIICPKLENAEVNLNEKINFRVINGDNLKGVKYDWFVNGVKVTDKYYKINEVGCFEVKVRMTHEGTGISKEITSEVHGLLPEEILKNDLEAILRIGQFKPPSQPPSIDKKRADEAEERIYTYFAPGCNDVRNQLNQKKSLSELLNADLRGGAGKLYGIEVKSIRYKNNGCDKVCSFMYVLK